MARVPLRHLLSLEGQRVSIALSDGRRIDDSQLISAGRSGTSTLWVFSNGMDVFVPIKLVVDIWEVAPGASRRVA